MSPLAFGYLKGGARSGDKIYLSNGVKATYDEAVTICNENGGQLASPYNSAENNAILTVCNQYDTDVVLGINNKKTDGIFQYLKNVVIAYENWESREPNNYIGIK